MQRRPDLFLLLFIIIAVVMTSAVRTTPVYADDGSTDPVPEETAAPPEEEQPPQESAPAVEIPATEEAPPTVPEGVEAAAVEETAPGESVTVSEILEQLPEDTALVVVNDEGQVEPLATVEAAEIAATGDPLWCPVGATPGDASCTNPGPGNVNYDPTSFNSLLTYLAGNPAYSGSGVIWVEAVYNGNDNSQVTLDGDALYNLSGAANTLTIRGGWSGGNNTTVNPATPSTSDVSLAVINWQGNITIENFDIVAAEDNASVGLLVDTTGDITLNNVSVLDTPANTTDGIGDGAILFNTGNVDITDSNFNENAGYGLIAFSGGDITLDTVSANDNTLTGAYLDTCLYGTVDPGVCAGIGDVIITGSSTAPYSSQFDHNGYNLDGSGNLTDGLIVNSGGSITIDHTQAALNSVGGATLMNDGGTGDVAIDQSDFSLNHNGTGLSVFTAGNLTVSSLQAFGNSMGAQLFIDGSGATSISNSNFGWTPGTANTATGLHVEAGGPVTLNTVTASYNGANGGYIEAEGNITVNNSTFNANVQINSPADPGLRAISWNGSITLNNVTASENFYGPGVGLDTFGAGTITVNGGFLNQNGTFGLQAGSDDGDITLNDVTASYNQVTGAHLGAFQAGNITVNNSVFVENGSYGIYAFASEGNINLNLVTVLGTDGAPGPLADDLTDYGALLKAAGDVAVTNSTFQLNTYAGLKIISGGQVNLTNVLADQNGGSGVEVYSVTTAGPICQGATPASAAVIVDSGTFTNNGGYGLLAKPGPGGTLVFVNPATFGGNGLGDYLLNLSQNFKDCTPGPGQEEPSKGPLIVNVPSTGGPTVEQDCDRYTGTILKLPDGTWAKIDCPFEGFSHLEEVLEENLPTPIGAGIDFVLGIDLRLTDGQGHALLNEDGTVTLSFALPEGSRDGHYSILFWDPALNDGAGGWVELPPYEAGTRFALHPDDPEDVRTVLLGVRRVGDSVTATVDFSGTFVLVER